MPKTLPGDENILLHTHPYNLNSPLEKIDSGEKNSEPYPLRHYLRLGALYNARTLTYPGYEPDRHHLTQGTKDNEHYTAMTKREDKWTLYYDALTTQTTTKNIHQTQAYILMYRKTEQSTGMGKSAPTDIPKKLESQ